MKNVIRKILDHLETELICYQELSATYDEQKEVLIKNGHQELGELDNRFTTLYNKINKYDLHRKNLFNELKPGIEKLSEVIKIAEREESPNVEKLKEYNEKFKLLKTELEKKRFVNYYMVNLMNLT